MSNDVVATSATLINGRLTHMIDSAERALSYGDGLFETIRLHNGIPLFWDAHIARLIAGCERLKINCPHNLKQLLLDDVSVLIERASLKNAALKLILSRGAGPRGYKYSEQLQATRIVSINPCASFELQQKQGVALYCCATALARQPLLSGLKHLNRLEQVLARSEWQQPDIFEGVVCDTSGFVIEGTMSNLFWYKEGCWFTPSLAWAGVEGIIRQVILQLMPTLQMEYEQGEYLLAHLLEAEQVFVCNSLIDIVPVRTIFNGDAQYDFATEGATLLLQQTLQQHYIEDSLR